MATRATSAGAHRDRAGPVVRRCARVSRAGGFDLIVNLVAAWARYDRNGTECVTTLWLEAVLIVTAQGIGPP